MREAMSKALLKALSFGRLKHKKLPEEWGDSIKQPVNEGMCFYVKYLGSQLVDKASSDIVTAEAIKNIILMAKSRGNKKLARVSLCIRPSGITTTDVTTGEQLHDVSIYRISYCSADATYDRVVAFIATNKNETMECHAFLTSKRKVSQAAALTISQAFTIAFENWQNSKTGKSAAPAPATNPGAKTASAPAASQPMSSAGQQQPVTSTPMKGKKAGASCGSTSGLSSTHNNGLNNNPNEGPTHLIDLSFEEFSRGAGQLREQRIAAAAADADDHNDSGNNSYLAFDLDPDLDDSFSRLAHSRARDPLTGGQEDGENRHPNKGGVTGGKENLLMSSLLPSNIRSLDLDSELSKCFTSQRNARDDKFFAEKDDLLCL